MYVCVECRVQMTCDKNEVGTCVAHSDSVYAGDRFKCPKCGKMILATNPRSHPDPDRIGSQEYLELRD